MGNTLNNQSFPPGVFITKLKQIIDDRGAVYHYLKKSDFSFKEFGEAYFSIINPNVTKGWKKHFNTFQNFCVPSGKLKFVIYDSRINSKTFNEIFEIILDDNINYYRLSLPPDIWYSFKCISEFPTIIANVTDISHQSMITENQPIGSKDIPYTWE